MPNLFSVVAALVFLLNLAACDENAAGSKGLDAGTALSDGDPAPFDASQGPTDPSASSPEEQIKTVLRDRSYQQWLKEASIHRSTATHGRVRTYFNELVKTSLQANNSEHPVGAMLVKELYNENNDNLRGFAVSLKVSRGRALNTWFWYEVFSTDVNQTPEVSAPGASACAGCHAGGRDFVLTALPR